MATDPTGTPVQTKVTSVANVIGTLMNAGPSRIGGWIQNPLSSPIWISGDPACPSAPPSAMVPAATNGVAGQFKFDSAPRGLCYYVCAANGDFTLWTW